VLPIAWDPRIRQRCSLQPWVPASWKPESQWSIWECSDAWMALILAREPKYMAGAMIPHHIILPNTMASSFLVAGGHKLADEDEEAIERNLGLVELANPSLVHGDDVGGARRVDNACDEYIALVKQNNPELSLAGIRIVVDARTAQLVIQRRHCCDSWAQK